MVKHSSSFHKQRRTSFSKILQEHFEEHQNTEVQQSVVLEILGLNVSRKGQDSTAVKQAFPNTLVQRRGKEHNMVYVNLARKRVSFSPSSESDIPTVESSSINNLKKLIASISSELDAVTKRIECQLESDEIKRDVILVLLEKQRSLQFKIRDLSGNLESLYEKEIQRMVDDPSQKILCSKYKDERNNELKTFISYLNIRLENDYLEEVNFLDKFSSLPDNAG